MSGAILNTQESAFPFISMILYNQLVKIHLGFFPPFLVVIFGVSVSNSRGASIYFNTFCMCVYVIISIFFSFKNLPRNCNSKKR